MIPGSDPRPIDRVLDRLGNEGCNPRQTSTPHQWTARCPVTGNHSKGDKNPSLSIAESVDGKALITCHRGCTVPDIAKALNLGLRDLFPKRDKVVDLDQRRISAIYGYHDADGELVYEVVRYTPKTFRQRKPDGNGGYTWTIADIPETARPLYQLPQVQLAIANDHTIWICEGEKDAENLQWEIPTGDVATTNSGGATAWRQHHADSLRGANVIIIPDMDDTGRNRAANIVSTLAGIAKTIRILTPPAPAKDATEALRNGHKPDTWRTWPIERVHEWLTSSTDTTDETPQPVTELVNWTEFWNTDHATEDWLIEPLLPRARAVAVYAPAKTGKSLIILSAIAAACTGRSVWGWPEQAPVRVLYLDYEMTPADLKERLELLGYGPNHDLTNLRYALIPSLPPLDSPEGGQALLELAQAEQVEAVIIDTFGRATTGDENDADTLRGYYRHTGSLLKKHGIASLRSDHAGKDLERGQRGTSAKNDDVDVVLKLSRTDDGIKATRTHTRMTWVPETIDLIRHEDANGYWEFRRSIATAHGWPAGTKEIADLLDQANAPLTISARAAAELLRTAGHQANNNVIRAAVRWRKQPNRTITPSDNAPTHSEITAEKRAPLDGAHTNPDRAPTQRGAAGRGQQTPPLTSQNTRGALGGAAGRTHEGPGARSVPLGTGAPDPHQNPEQTNPDLNDYF